MNFFTGMKEAKLFHIVFLFFILIISSVHAAQESFEQKSLVPVVITVGGSLFNADALLYHQATQPNPLLDVDDVEEKALAFEEAEGFDRFGALFDAWLARTKKFINVAVFYLTILVRLYTVTMTFFIVRWMISKVNTSAELFQYICAIIFMLLIGALFGSFVFQYDTNGEKIAEGDFPKVWAKQINPVKGVIYTATHTNEIWGPLMGEVDLSPGETRGWDLQTNTTNASQSTNGSIAEAV